MNDKKFIQTKVKKSIKKLLGKKYASGQELQRINLLGGIVASILHGGESQIAKIGEHLNDGVRKLASVKKQISRFMENKHISPEVHYLPFIEELLAALGQTGELEIIIDGSVVGKGCMCLMFSVVYKGRAIPIIWKVVKKKKGHFKESEHIDLLEKLQKLIPSEVKIMVLGDGEFDGTKWQKKIRSRCGDYGLRTAKNIKFKNSDGEEFQPQDVGVEEGQSLLLEDLTYSSDGYGPVNLLVWHGKGHEEPLYLVTNIDDGYKLESYYMKRFLIETFFRDIKSKGFNIQKSGLRDPKKLNRLIICCCLAFVMSVFAGVKARQSVFYDLVCEQYENALSLFQLGLRFIRKLVDLRQWRAFSIRYDILLNLD